MRIQSELPNISQISRLEAKPDIQLDFAHLMKDALTAVNAKIQSADQAAVLLANGQMEIHNAVIMAEKASLALQLTIAIRNKVLEAYQEIMRMQV